MKYTLVLIAFLAIAQDAGQQQPTTCPNGYIDVARLTAAKGAQVTPSCVPEQKTLDDVKWESDARYSRIEGWRKEQLVDRKEFARQMQALIDKLAEAATVIREHEVRIKALEAKQEVKARLKPFQGRPRRQQIDLSAIHRGWATAGTATRWSSKWLLRLMLLAGISYTYWLSYQWGVASVVGKWNTIFAEAAKSRDACMASLMEAGKRNTQYRWDKEAHR